MEFYIDGVLQSGRISGEVNWTLQTFNILPGTHTLRWRYVKDGIISSGQDKGWVDYLSFDVWTYSLSPGSAVFSTNGDAGTVAITTYYPWTVTETNDWITITTAISGNGNGSFSYTVAANPGRPRAGFITVGGQTHSIAQLGVVPPGQFDFTDDNLTDLLFQRTDGALAAWAMNGTNFLRSVLLRTPAAGWRCFGAGDFDGNGKEDLLFQHNTTGKLAVWYMDKTNFVSSALLRGGPGAFLARRQRGGFQWRWQTRPSFSK